jgi:hypothetical protein
MFESDLFSTPAIELLRRPKVSPIFLTLMDLFALPLHDGDLITIGFCKVEFKSWCEWVDMARFSRVFLDKRASSISSKGSS